MIIYNAPIKVGPILDPITDIVFPDGFIKGFANYTEYQDNNSQVHNVPQFQVNSNDLLLYNNNDITTTTNDYNISCTNVFDLQSTVNVNLTANNDLNLYTNGGMINLISANNIVLDALNANISLTAFQIIQIIATDDNSNISIDANGELGKVNINTNGIDGSINLTANGDAGFIGLDCSDGIYIYATKGLVNKPYTTIQINALSAPNQGALVYNTTLKTLCFYDGTIWNKVVHLPM